LLKLKSFEEDEALVMGYTAGKGKHEGAVGALDVKVANGRQFKLGSGLTDADRRQPPPIGSIVTFRYQTRTDSGLPRFPTFVAMRTDVTFPTDNTKFR